MKIIVDLQTKSLRMLENERSIFRGEYGADKLELYINKQLENEYPTITALLSNGRKIGAYSSDEEFEIVELDSVQYTIAKFTLSKQNGFTLSEGKMQITIWMNSNGKKEAIGNVLVNVVNTSAFDDGDIIISGDVEGTLVNYRVELENLQSQINSSNIDVTNKFNKLSEEKQNKVMSNGLEVEGAISDLKTQADMNSESINNLEINKADTSAVNSKITELDTKLTAKITEKFNQILGEGASETLDTIGEISKALEEHNNEYDSLLAVVGDKADRSELFSRNYNDLTNKPFIPTKLSDLEKDIEVGGGGSGGISEEQVVDIVDTKIADLVNSAPETLDTLGELAQAIQENENVVEALNSAIGDKANKSSVESVEERLEQAESDIAVLQENSGGVSEDDVMNIIEENSETAEELEIVESETLNIGTSVSYDETSDNEVPTTKAVKTMIGNGGSNELVEKIEVNYEDLGESFCVSIHIENNDFDFTKPFRINLYENETNRENELQNKDGSYHNYLTFDFSQQYLRVTSVVNNDVYDVGFYTDYFILDTLHGIFNVAFLIPYEAENHLIAEIFSKENNFLTIASVHGSKRTYTTPLVYYET